MMGAGHGDDHQDCICLPALGIPAPTPFQLLELTIISAQNLYPASKSMQAYASAWIHSDQKLYTHIDPYGHTDPTWNDKFVFRVDDAFLQSDTSAITIQLKAARRRFSPFADHVLGEVRVILSAIRPAAGLRRFVALQVRRPSSLKPYGILNLGLAPLDGYVKSMPLYYDLGSFPAFAFKDLMDGRRSPSMPKSREDPSESWHHRNTDKDENKLQRDKSATEELKSKKNMWKAEISPDMVANHSDIDYHERKKKTKSKKTMRWKSIRWLSCFFG